MTDITYRPGTADDLKPGVKARITEHRPTCGAVLARTVTFEGIIHHLEGNFADFEEGGAAWIAGENYRGITVTIEVEDTPAFEPGWHYAPDSGAVRRRDDAGKWWQGHGFPSAVDDEHAAERDFRPCLPPLDPTDEATMRALCAAVNADIHIWAGFTPKDLRHVLAAIAEVAKDGIR